MVKREWLLFSSVIAFKEEEKKDKNIFASTRNEGKIRLNSRDWDLKKIGRRDNSEEREERGIFSILAASLPRSISSWQSGADIIS